MSDIKIQKAILRGKLAEHENVIFRKNVLSEHGFWIWSLKRQNKIRDKLEELEK